MTEQTAEIQNLLTEIKSGWSGVSALPAEVKALREGGEKLATDLKDVRRQLTSRQCLAAPRGRGVVSEDCARHLAATFIAHCERSDKLDALCSAPSQRDALTAFARDTLDLSARAALTTSDIPLPVHYSGEIRELISEFGVVRRWMSPYPIGMGTARPARMGTRPKLETSARTSGSGSLRAIFRPERAAPDSKRPARSLSANFRRSRPTHSCRSSVWPCGRRTRGQSQR